MPTSAKALAQLRAGLIFFAGNHRLKVVLITTVTVVAGVGAINTLDIGTRRARGPAPVRHLSGTDSAQRLELAQPGPQPLPEYAALFERFGVAPTIDADATVDPTPPSMRLVTADGVLRMRYVPYNGPGSTPQSITKRREKPRICVTWGHTIGAIGNARPCWTR